MLVNKGRLYQLLIVKVLNYREVLNQTLDSSGSTHRLKSNLCEERIGRILRTNLQRCPSETGRSFGKILWLTSCEEDPVSKLNGFLAD